MRTCISLDVDGSWSSAHPKLMRMEVVRKNMVRGHKQGNLLDISLKQSPAVLIILLVGGILQPSDPGTVIDTPFSSLGIWSAI